MNNLAAHFDVCAVRSCDVNRTHWEKRRWRANVRCISGNCMFGYILSCGITRPMQMRIGGLFMSRLAAFVSECCCYPVCVCFETLPSCTMLKLRRVCHFPATVCSVGYLTVAHFIYAFVCRLFLTLLGVKLDMWVWMVAEVSAKRRA